MAESIKSVYEYIKNHPLFYGLTDSQLQYLAQKINILEYNKNQFVIHEDEEGEDIYIIKEGIVDICKYDQSSKKYITIKELTSDDVIGEISLFDHLPRSASARTKTSCSIYCIKKESIFPPPPNRFRQFLALFKREDNAAIPRIIMENATKNITTRLRNTNEAMLVSLRNEVSEYKAREVLSRFVIGTFTLLSLYIFIFRGLIESISHFGATTAISVPLMILFVMPLIYLMKSSGYPLSLYGVTLDNWRSIAIEAVGLTIPLLLVIVIYKAALIHFDTKFANDALFNLSLRGSSHEHVSEWYALSMIILYMVFVPVQELMARGALQSSFQLLLTGTFRTFWAIILSNLIFSSFHMFVSATLGLLVFVPGLYWGWMYARQNSLVGVIASHWLVGLWTFFIVGIL